MRVLVTGAGGFVGRALTARLLAAAPAAGTGGEGLELVLVDQQLRDPPGGPRVSIFEGDFGDRVLIERAIGRGVDRDRGLRGGAADGLALKRFPL